MKFSKLTLLSFGFLISHQVFAEAKDLKPLYQKWLHQDKTAKASSLIEVGIETLEESEDRFHDILAKESTRLKSEGKILQNFEMNALTQDSRKQLLKILASRGESTRFCESFPSKDLDLIEDNIDEHKKTQRRADFTQCKKIMADLLGGIIYSDPEIFQLELSFKDEKSKTMPSEFIFYVKSLVDSKNYLRYRLTVS